MSTSVNVNGLAPNEVADARDRLTALFDESYDSVYRYCLARTGSVVQAEDVSAEVFAVVAKRFAGGNVEHMSIAWLITVAKRRLIDQWRSTERQRQHLAGLASDAREESICFLEEADQAVLAALRSLPPRQRLALTLRYLDDMSVQEVADCLSVRYQAAESLLARGRRSFAKAYEAMS